MASLSTLEKAEALLPHLNVQEKEALLRQLYALRHNHERGIRKLAGVCGGRACIEGTRIPVWTFVNFRQQGLTEIEILYNYPGLAPQDLKSAWKYYLQNQEEIEADIADQASEL